MRIVNSGVMLDGRSELTRLQTSSTSFRITRAQQPDNSNLQSGSILMNLSEHGLELSRTIDSLSEHLGAFLDPNSELIKSEEANSHTLSDKDKTKIALIEDFVYYLTGRRIKIRVPEMVQRNNSSKPSTPALPQGSARNNAGLSIDFRRFERFHEIETASFQALGRVETADGRSIDFNLRFAVSREFISESMVRVQTGDALVDPLTLNMNNNIASLGQRNFRFDLNSDGTEDTIAFAGAGSGFLALDRNGNGEIDDGQELFGPSTGNGFSELEHFDKDGNSWIDEGDPIFDKLQIWSMDENGNARLEAIGEKGVGAIYLGNVATPFSLLGSDGSLSGRIARSGVFLHESGQAGVIQHVDLRI